MRTFGDGEGGGGPLLCASDLLAHHFLLNLFSKWDCQSHWGAGGVRAGWAREVTVGSGGGRVV